MSTVRCSFACLRISSDAISTFFGSVFDLNEILLTSILFLTAFSSVGNDGSVTCIVASSPCAQSPFDEKYVFKDKKDKKAILEGPVETLRPFVRNAVNFQFCVNKNLKL